MQQFIRGSEAAFTDLKRRARGGCVVFNGQHMPPGSVPDRARVGFEVDPIGESAALFVDRGISYGGLSAEVRAWLDAGEIRFDNFDGLKHWVRGPLASCYGVTPAMRRQLQPCERPEPPPDPRSLTDLAMVQQERIEPDGPIYLDEPAVLRELQSHVRGQDEAIRVLAQRVYRHAARRQPVRPATLFAVGPTGCGKTKTAESLPLVLRRLDPKGAGYGYLRLDMSEYQERHRVSQLLGAPQGYVGYGEGAQLVDALAANPRTVVLFDEIEKAHADVFRTLMNAMDAGRLSTPAKTENGRTVDCRQAIFLFTSNLDAGEILRDLEQRGASVEPDVVNDVCRRRLRTVGLPGELLGRISAFLVFRPLSSDARAEIVTLAIARVAEEYGLCMAHIEPSVVVAVLDRAGTNGFGARPDEYLVDELLGPTLAQAAASSVRSPIRISGGPPFRSEPVAHETMANATR